VFSSILGARRAAILHDRKSILRIPILAASHRYPWRTRTSIISSTDATQLITAGLAAAGAPLRAKSTIGGTAMKGGRSLAMARTLHLNPTTVQGNTLVLHPRPAVSSHKHALLPCCLAACAAKSAVRHIACHPNNYSLCLRKPIAFEDQSTAELVAPMAPHGEQLGLKRSRGWVPLRICSLLYSSRSHCHSHQHFELAPCKFPAKNGACTYYSHGRRSSTPVISHVLLL
jgi:hypothetical protein